MKIYGKFNDAILATTEAMKTRAQEVHTNRWQGVDISQKPEMATFELLNHSMSVIMGKEDLEFYRNDIKPNTPWADDHFKERVSGCPLNPGTEWANWPYAKSADTFRENDKFNHTYMERYWPKLAGRSLFPIETPESFNSQLLNEGLDRVRCTRGIYHEYGDLQDVVNQLANEPDTRQAILPVFFPEDTGAVHKGRIPCSLHYHFIQRNGFLHIIYSLRSCDFTRHFRDDLYLTVRLLIWVLARCREQNDFWKTVKPGIFTIHITSLHCFKNDMIALKKG